MCKTKRYSGEKAANMIVDGLLSDKDNSSLDESHLSSGSHSDYAYSDSSETGKNFNNDTSAASWGAEV